VPETKAGRRSEVFVDLVADQEQARAAAARSAIPSHSPRGITAPVGLLGELMTTAFVPAR